MSDIELDPALARALALSQDMLAAAETGEFAILIERRSTPSEWQLLKSFRRKARSRCSAIRSMLQQISQLNDRAIGLLEHQRRSKGRDLDMAAVGRRAVAAYASIGHSAKRIEVERTRSHA